MHRETEDFHFKTFDPEKSLSPKPSFHVTKSSRIRSGNETRREPDPFHAQMPHMPMYMNPGPPGPSGMEFPVGPGPPAPEYPMIPSGAVATFSHLDF